MTDFVRFRKADLETFLTGNKAVIYARKMEKAFEKMVIVTLNSLFNMSVITFESAYAK